MRERHSAERGSAADSVIGLIVLALIAYVLVKCCGGSGAREAQPDSAITVTWESDEEEIIVEVLRGNGMVEELTARKGSRIELMPDAQRFRFRHEADTKVVWKWVKEW